MTALTLFSDSDPNTALSHTTDANEIASQLKQVGICFEQWSTHDTIDANACPDDVISAYQADVDRLCEQGGYQSVDVISLAEDNPKKAELRKKFLDEHTHSEDEVRFFVRGNGLFYLHLDEKVYALFCEQGDLISVPADTKHWFDMGSKPNFTAIRLFTNPEGWIAQHTGDDIASHFPNYEALVSELA